MLNTRGGMLEVVGIPMSVRGNVLDRKVCDVFQEIGMDICDRDIQACHHLKNQDQTIVNFTNRKDCLQILRVKRQLKGLDPLAVDLPEGTKIFVSESLWPYWRGIWNKWKKLRDKQKVHQYYTIDGLIRLQIEESGQAKIILLIVFRVFFQYLYCLLPICELLCRLRRFWLLLWSKLENLF